MTIKSDHWFRHKNAAAVAQGKPPLIEPFEPQLVSAVQERRVVSYGTSSYGYDVRLAPEFKVFDPLYQGVVDPKRFDEGCLRSVHVPLGASLVLPAGGFALACTVEYVRIPRECVALLACKSTYARVGLNVNFTVMEPEWEGQITLELANTAPLPIRLYPGEGIAQLLFFEAGSVCAQSYAERAGKYQGQQGVTPPLMGVTR